MNKTYHRLILVGLFLYLAGTPALANEPPLTGITIDEELAQLLAQVVPYTGDLLKEKRFLFNLNKLINEDLKEQDEKYKPAAVKLAMRMALAINKTVDSIEVRRSTSATSYGMWQPHSGTMTWDLGGVLEDKWEHWSGEVTIVLFALKDGKFVKINLCGIASSCSGMFTDCCGQAAYPSGIDDAWFRHFVDLGREADFPARFRIQPQVNESRSGAQ